MAKNFSFLILMRHSSSVVFLKRSFSRASIPNDLTTLMPEKIS